MLTLNAPESFWFLIVSVRRLGFRWALVGVSMAALQPYGCGVVGARGMPSFDGLRLAPSITPLASSVGIPMVGLKRRGFPGLVVKAATVVAPKVYQLN